MNRTKVPFRVHGPWRHRSKWRLDVFDRGQRMKLSFASYGEALRAAHDMLTARGVEITLETTDGFASGKLP